MSTGDPINTLNTGYLPGDMIYKANWVTTNNTVVSDINQPMVDLLEVVRSIQDRLAIIEADATLMEKFPALKEAYDNYKLIEAMVKEGDKK